MSGVQHLDHVNILTGNVERTVSFLTAVLGLENGPRPAFRSPGFWLYKNGSPLVHISDVANKEQTHAADDSLGDPSKSGARGIVDHVAFRCTDYAATTAKLRELRIAMHESDIPGSNDRQVFIDGPDNVSFELIFSAADVAAAKAAQTATTP